MNYVIAKHLRKRTEYNVDLLLQDYNSIYDHPAWEDIPIKIPQQLIRTKPAKAYQILADAIQNNRWQMPSWIKENKIEYHTYDKIIAKYIDRSHIIKKQITHYVNDLKNYDFVFTDGFGAISALLAKVPYAIRPFGSDLDIFSFENNYRGKMIKKALIEGRAIFAHGYTKNLRKLGIESKRKVISVIIDINKLKPLKQNRNRIPEFFIASRLDFSIKGTDKAIRAFAKLLKSYDAHLFCLEFGSHIEEVKRLINSLGITDNVTFYNFVASKPVLVELYNKHDAIIGNLNYGTLGTTELEAMSCDKQVIAYVKPEIQIEKDFPIMNSFYEEEIYNSMKGVCDGSNLPTGMRQFIELNFSPEKFIAEFEEILQTN